MADPAENQTKAAEVADAHTISKAAAYLYSDFRGLARIIQRGRPHICPFEVLSEAVPPGARLLDIGCGSGLFLGWLALSERIRSGVGVEPSASALAAAQSMVERLRESGSKVKLDFRQAESEREWPAEDFDAVSIIDVMHHVPPDARADFLERTTEVLRPGGLVIYKDMAQRPAFYAFMNQMHDLVMAREWIRLEPIANVERWAEAAGLRLRDSGTYRRAWYAHELRVWQKPS